MPWRRRAAAPRRAAAILLAAAVAAGVAAGSQIGYYGQAIGGHLDLMRARKPIDELLRAPATDPDLRLRLAEVQAIRDFASRDLGLPDNGSYRSYADLGRPYGEHGSSELRAADATQRQRRAAWLALLQSHRERLAALYASELPPADKRAAKAALFAALGRERSALRAAWGSPAGSGHGVDDDLNNARLASLALYSELVPAFERLLASQDHDLPRFHRAVAGLAALAASERDAALRALLPPAGGGNRGNGAVARGSEDENSLPVR